MTAFGDAIRRATLAASRLHRDLSSQSSVLHEDGLVDVFAAAAKLDVPLILRPLDGLLGAYIRQPSPGILLTTQRPLKIQRFTAAHELGHHVMKHEPSLDDESILRRTPFVLHKNTDLQELEADAFAAAFLLPRWLLVWQMKQRGWTKEHLKRPLVVYQLALRVGMSYAATCWTLNRYEMLDDRSRRGLLDIAVKEIKEAILGPIKLDNYHPDVWLLTKRDTGTHLVAAPGDVFVVRLPENSNAGYTWTINHDPKSRLSILNDSRHSTDNDEEAIGSPVIRQITAKPDDELTGFAELTERREWDPDGPPLGTFAVRYELAREDEGLSRAERRKRLEAA